MPVRVTAGTLQYFVLSARAHLTKIWIICEQYTHKYSTYRVAQQDHVSSREHAWLKSCKAQDCTSVCPKNNCHPRVMSHSLPHLTLTTSTSSHSPFSSTSHVFPTVSPAQTRSMVVDPYLPCDVPRQSGGSSQIPSLTVYEPNRLRPKPKQSSLKTSSPEELSLEGILGQIRIKYLKDS